MEEESSGDGYQWPAEPLHLAETINEQGEKYPTGSGKDKSGRRRLRRFRWNRFWRVWTKPSPALKASFLALAINLALTGVSFLIVRILPFRTEVEALLSGLPESIVPFLHQVPEMLVRPVQAGVMSIEFYAFPWIFGFCSVFSLLILILVLVRYEKM